MTELVTRWREGRHAQIEIGRVALWAGYTADRWMVGAVFNHRCLVLSIAMGPLYVGIGAAYDR